MNVKENTIFGIISLSIFYSSFEQFNWVNKSFRYCQMANMQMGEEIMKKFCAYQWLEFHYFGRHRFFAHNFIKLFNFNTSSQLFDGYIVRLIIGQFRYINRISWNFLVFLLHCIEKCHFNTWRMMGDIKADIFFFLCSDEHFTLPLNRVCIYNYRIKIVLWSLIQCKMIVLITLKHRVSEYKPNEIWTIFCINGIHNHTFEFN